MGNEFILVQVEGRPALRFAAAYGFRNIQNLVQKMKRGKCPYHFVEVMACPSGTCTLVHVIYSGIPLIKTLSPGCLNGGGQIRPGEGEPAKQLLTRVEAVYSSVT